MHNHSLLGFKIATILLIQGVDSSTSVMIPCLVSSANLYFSGSSLPPLPAVVHAVLVVL